MDAPSHIAAFFIAVLVMELTPGPNMGWLALVSAGRGRRAGVAAVAGVALGLTMNGLIAAAGLATIIARSDLAWEALRWGGICFLIFMAAEAWRDRGESSQARLPEDDRLRFFLRGLIVNLLNPKAALFYVAVLPEFIDRSRDVVSQAVVLTLGSVAIATAVHAAIVFSAAPARALLSSPHRHRLARRGLALGLLGIAVWIALSTAR